MAALAAVLGAALAAGCSRPAATAKHEDESYRISTATLATMIRAGVPMVLLDARTGQHDDGRRIPGAVGAAPDVPEAELARLVGDKNRLVITYCKDPECPNFRALAARLRQFGYDNVLENPGGIDGWAASGRAVATAGAAPAAGGQ